MFSSADNTPHVRARGPRGEEQSGGIIGEPILGRAASHLSVGSMTHWLEFLRPIGIGPSKAESGFKSAVNAMIAAAIKQSEE